MCPPQEFSLNENPTIIMTQYCQQRSIMIRPRPKHLFKDITSFWDPTYKVSSAWSLPEFENAIKNGNPIKTSAWCVICNKVCKITKCFCHVAGTPCQDWSSQGSRRGADGENLQCTMCWVAMRHALEDDTFLNENVPGFDHDLILKTLSTKYAIFSVVVNLESLGWPVRRPRRLTYGLHKKRVMARLQWDIYVGGIQRKHFLDWSVFLSDSLADTEGALAELSWAQKRKNSLWNKSVNQAMKTAGMDKADEAFMQKLSELKSKSKWTEALTLSDP